MKHFIPHLDEFTPIIHKSQYLNPSNHRNYLLTPRSTYTFVPTPSKNNTANCASTLDTKVNKFAYSFFKGKLASTHATQRCANQAATSRARKKNGNIIDATSF